MNDPNQGDDGRVQWFGRSWGAAVCDPERHRVTPVGEPCLFCDNPIAADDQGLISIFATQKSATRRASHLRCFLRSVGIAVEPEPEKSEDEKRAIVAGVRAAAKSLASDIEAMADDGPRAGPLTELETARLTRSITDRMRAANRGAADARNQSEPGPSLRLIKSDDEPKGGS